MVFNQSLMAGLSAEPLRTTQKPSRTGPNLPRTYKVLSAKPVESSQLSHHLFNSSISGNITENTATGSP